MSKRNHFGVVNKVHRKMTFLDLASIYFQKLMKVEPIDCNGRFSKRNMRRNKKFIKQFLIKQFNKHGWPQ